MRGKNNVGFDWPNFNEKAQDILGEDFWNNINSSIPRRGPNIDLYNTEKEIVAVIEMPGISPSDKVSIRVKNNRLIVTGTIPWIYPVGEEDLIHRERFTGEFKREVRLPEDISQNGFVDAQYQNGLVIIHLQRIPSEDEKEIHIKFTNL